MAAYQMHFLNSLRKAKRALTLGGGGHLKQFMELRQRLKKKLKVSMMSLAQDERLAHIQASVATGGSSTGFTCLTSEVPIGR